MKILIADDHSILRKGLMQILADEFPEAQFGEASNTPETLERLCREAWDLLVLDIFMPGRSGLEILGDVRRNYPNLPVLALSSAPEDQLAVRVLKSGARGYLNKQTAPEELVNAVRKVLSGSRYISTAVAEMVAAEISYTDGPLHEKLSDREYTVLQLLVVGKSIKAIADELSLSPKTVSTYHARIWGKLGVKNDVEMVHYALEHGLVQDGL
jgi:two-component system, NarL family, invasion response regulator UvrY